MGDFTAFERFYRFDALVRTKKYPNSSWLVKTFEINERTARRTIDFMRDRLGAPLEYDLNKRGYYYPDDSYQLPRFQISQEELLSLLISRNLLSQSAGGFISDQISSFFQKLISIDGAIPFNSEQLGELFSSVWVGYRPTRPSVFKVVLQALLEKRVLDIAYVGTNDEQEKLRTVEPHHLQHYMGSWMLVAWCRVRNDWRNFALVRIKNAVVRDEPFEAKPSSAWRPRLEGGYGLFQGDQLTKVVLKFNKFRANWVRDEWWHHNQEMEEWSDGSLRLSFPVSAFHEVKMRILQYGVDVVVEEPAELRREVAAEIERMGQLYRK
jgi:predicted DNA-binding transcriptional regulator YafY